MSWRFITFKRFLAVRHGFALVLLFVVGLLILTSNYVIVGTVNNGGDHDYRTQVHSGKRALQRAFSHEEEIDKSGFMVKLNSNELQMEDQRDLISILNPEGLQQYDKSVTEQKSSNEDSAAQLIGLQKSLQAASQLTGLLPVKLEGTGFLTPKMLRNADESYYRSLAVSYGLQYRNRSQEQMFLKEFVRSNKCRRVLSSNTTESLRILQTPSEAEDLDYISPQSILVLTDKNSDKYARQRLLDYCLLHSYQFFECHENQTEKQSKFSWKLKCIQDAMVNSSQQAVVWVDANVFITNVAVRLENIFRLPSRFSSSKLQRSADFLSADLAVSVKDWTDSYEFLKTDMLIVRNSQRNREFLTETAALHLHLRLNRAQYGQLDDQLLSLAYYRATEFCIHTLLLPTDGLLTSSLTKWQSGHFSLSPSKEQRKIFRLLSNIPPLMWPKVVKSAVDNQKLK